MTDMTVRVEHWNTAADGELSESAMRRKLESKGYGVTRYVYPPGTCFADHSHQVDKMDAVLSGQFMMQMEGEKVILRAGDALAVPRGVVHRAEVVGGEAVVSLDAVKY
jgi:quercetin dioxygenase-like cupin family protein